MNTTFALINFAIVATYCPTIRFRFPSLDLDLNSDFFIRVHSRRDFVRLEQRKREIEFAEMRYLRAIGACVCATVSASGALRNEFSRKIAKKTVAAAAAAAFVKVLRSQHA